LGDYVIVYGEFGTAAIKPMTSPAPSYSIIKLDCGGLASRGAVGGNDEHHVFVDTSGALVELRGDLSVNPLGYREFFYDMLGSDVRVSFSANPQNTSRFGEFYISSGATTYYLNESGLCRTPQIVTSATYYQGATLGLGTDLEDTADITGELTIDTTDFLQPGLKTLEWVRLGGTETLWASGIDLQVAIDYRYKMGQPLTWDSTSYKKVNQEGVVYFPVTALDFRIKIKISDYENLDLDYIEVGFKHSDKRFKRNISVGSLGSRAD
jgi:hypothetical protein